MEKTHDQNARGWWTYLGAGPAGAFRTRREAEEAMSRWRWRHGAESGTIEAMHSARLAGPYPSRRAAREADISETIEDTVRRVYGGAR